MNYCYECGSEIAQIDTFCPFCGIALKPNTAAPEDQAIESKSAEQEKTVLVNQADLQEILPPTNSEPEASVENSFTSENQPTETTSESYSGQNNDAENHYKIENEHKIENEPNAESENELNTPELKPSEVVESREDSAGQKEISESVSVSDKIADSSGDFLEIESKSPEIETPQVVNEITEQRIKEKDSEPILSADENNLISEPSETESENRPEAQNFALPASEDEFVQTIPYVNYNDLVNKNSSSENSINQKKDAAKLDSESEKVIEKPEIPIEETERRDTTFDSVKIMDDVKKETVAEDSGVSINENIELNSEDKPKVIAAENKEKERSYTTPNFGKGDTAGSKSPKLKPLEEGTVLNGRYEVVRKIGGGGMGAVYLATDRNLGGILRAVKEMIQSYIEETQQDKAISDFKRESMLLTSLDHPSIPTIYDYFYDDKEGRFYLVMKYISGGDLASRLRAAPEGRIDEETVVDWAMQIADVLDYLHNRQPPIVYRDLKPANIMVDGNTGRTMLIDFGIARWINKEEKGVTAVGTMGYAPPELFSGKVEPSSDIYSLGSTMFHLLTGADPQSNPLLIFDFQKHPRPRQINPQLSDQIEKILLKMVEYSADKRFKSAAEVRDKLKQHLESLKSGKATFGIVKAPSAVSFSEQTVFCGFCGQKIVATDMFCAFCGSKQPLAQQGVHSNEYHPPQATAKLFVVGTNELEVPTFVIEKDDNLVGRRDPLSNIFPEVDLSKFDPQTKISRRHAHIWRDGNNFLLEDLGSSNGTLVLRVIGDAIKLNPHQPHTLVTGEKIKIGDTTLHFVVV